MRLVRLMPGGRVSRGRHSELSPQSSCRFCLFRGPWGQRRLLRTLTLVCVALVVAGLSLLAVSEVAIAQKRAVQNAVRSAARRIHGVHQPTRHHRQPPASATTAGVPFKVEPLLTRNAPSVELATHLAHNAARASRLTQLIERNLNSSNLQKTVSWRDPDPPLCSAVPKTLQLPITSEVSYNVSAVTCDSASLGGSWHPPCSPRHRVALVIPYRDRWQHLLTLLAHLHPVLQRHQVAYTIFVVEQFGNDTFNKGAIMNAAFLSVVERQLGSTNFDCFIFHDVDLIPEDIRNMYTCPPQPRHMSVAVDELNYRLPYKILVGGVFAIRNDHFFRVNGYSNLYWGWGGEDDDMGYRVQQSGLLIIRPPEWIARYKMIKHVKRRPLAWKVRNKLLRTSGRRYRLDGLNTAHFRLLRVSKEQLFTRLLVDVGPQPNNIRVLQHEADNAAVST